MKKQVFPPSAVTNGYVVATRKYGQLHEEALG